MTPRSPTRRTTVAASSSSGTGRKWAPRVTARSRTRSRWRAASSSRRPSGHHDVELRPEPAGRPPGRPHQALGAEVGARDHHHPLRDGEGRPPLHGRTERWFWLVDRARHLPQGHLAQRPEVGGREEVEQRRLDALGRVDLPRPQACLERLGGEIDQDHLVGVQEHLIGDRLAHPDPGQLVDPVVEALQVLDVDRRDDVDAGVQEDRATSS